jgi:hypothetical protein
MNLTHEEFTDAMKRAALEPNADIRLVLVGALCGLQVYEKNAGYPRVTVSKGKSNANGGRTKYLTTDEQLAKRRAWIGETVTWEEHGVVYKIVDASWRGFILQYLKGGDVKSRLGGLKAADSMTKAERAITPGLKQSNPRKWRLGDGRTVQKRLEDDGLAHPDYVKKGA